jgi:hypothetical protein
MDLDSQIHIPIFARQGRGTGAAPRGRGWGVSCSDTVGRERRGEEEEEEEEVEGRVNRPGGDVCLVGRAAEGLWNICEVV